MQRLFLMTPFLGFQIIVGETDIITVTQMRLSDCIFSVCIITLTQNLLSVNQLPVNCFSILFRCILASLQEHYDLECWKHHCLKGLYSLCSLICSFVGTFDILVLRLFLMTQFLGFQIIVGETNIITLTQMRLSDYIFSVRIITLTQNLQSVNQLLVNCLSSF